MFRYCYSSIPRKNLHSFEALFLVVGKILDLKILFFGEKALQMSKIIAPCKEIRSEECTTFSYCDCSIPEKNSIVSWSRDDREKDRSEITSGLYEEKPLALNQDNSQYFTQKIRTG
ncbi:hypothetical protein M0802_011187 [Mischocyttarus mexicanus]|nr:hypothetical protein M0802_011187 [Mischocyttarus mexicanus]